MWKFKLFCAAFGAFVISFWLSFQEFQYPLWGRTTEAAVNRVYDRERAGRRSGGPERVASYSFQEAGAGNRDESTTVPLDWEPPSNGRVTVQYVPGAKNRSRIEGQRNTGALVVFFGSLAAVALLILKLAREANEPVRKPLRPLPQRR